MGGDMKMYIDVDATVLGGPFKAKLMLNVGTKMAAMAQEAQMPGDPGIFRNCSSYKCLGLEHQKKYQNALRTQLQRKAWLRNRRPASQLMDHHVQGLAIWINGQPRSNPPSAVTLPNLRQWISQSHGKWMMTPSSRRLIWMESRLRMELTQ